MSTENAEPRDKILIVDDVAVNIMLLQKYLSKHGYDVISANNASDGIALANREEPNIILLDIVMPEMDGYQACSILKKEQKTKDIPVFFLSAKRALEDKVMGLDVGAVDYITKPFDLKEILARIKTQIKLRKTSQRLQKSIARIEEDIKHASYIQKALLPSRPPEIRDLEFSWRFCPSFHVSGDIFNIIRLTEDKLGLYLADVSGHGVAAAMFSVLISQKLNSSQSGILKPRSKGSPGYKITPPHEVFSILNEQFSSAQFGNMFFTIFYCIIDTKNGVIEYCRAAHPPAFIVNKSGQARRLDKGGLPIGLIEKTSWETETSKLEHGETLHTFSDGLVESQKKDTSEIELFEEWRLEKLLTTLNAKPIDTINELVISKLIDFQGGTEFEDDVTIISMRRL